MALKFKKLTQDSPKELPKPPEQPIVINEVKEVVKEIKALYSTDDLKKDFIKAELPDKNDINVLKRGRKLHEGSDYSLFMQSPPLLFTRDGHNLWLGDMYRGCSAFLICNGPSFNEVLNGQFEFKGKMRTGKEILNYPGFITMGVNNGPRSFRPNLWTCVDSPTHFIKSIWFDPKIMKFAPFSFPDKTLFDNEKWEEMKTTVGECPNMVYYKRNEHFKAKQFLFEDSFNWGNHKDFGGGRSVMLVAMRMLYQLGIRTIFLLGVDLKMDENTKYHFEQDRSKGSINGNNATYKMLNERFADLKPIFNQYGLKVFNCNLQSNLHAFPKIKFEDAVEMAAKNIPVIETERTEGLYDREANNKNDPPDKKTKYTEYEKVAIKNKLDEARNVLNKLKEEHAKTNTEELKTKVMDARKIFRQLEAEKNKIWGIVKKK